MDQLLHAVSPVRPMLQLVMQALSNGDEQLEELEDASPYYLTTVNEMVSHIGEIYRTVIVIDKPHGQAGADITITAALADVVAPVPFCVSHLTPRAQQMFAGYVAPATLQRLDLTPMPPPAWPNLPGDDDCLIHVTFEMAFERSLSAALVMNGAEPALDATLAGTTLGAHVPFIAATCMPGETPQLHGEAYLVLLPNWERARVLRIIETMLTKAMRAYDPNVIVNIDPVQC